MGDRKGKRKLDVPNEINTRSRSNRNFLTDHYFGLEQKFSCSDDQFKRINKNDVQQCKNIILNNFNFRNPDDQSQSAQSVLEKEIEEHEYIWSVHKRDTKVVHAQLFMFRDRDDLKQRYVEICFAATAEEFKGHKYTPEIIKNNMEKWKDLGVTKIFIHSKKNMVEYWRKMIPESKEVDPTEYIQYDLIEMNHRTLLLFELQKYVKNKTRHFWTYKQLDEINQKLFDSLSDEMKTSLQPFFNNVRVILTNEREPRGKPSIMKKCHRCSLWYSTDIFNKHNANCRNFKTLP